MTCASKNKTIVTLVWIILCIDFKNLSEMDIFLEKYKLPKLIQETGNMNDLMY